MRRRWLLSLWVLAALSGLQAQNGTLSTQLTGTYAIAPADYYGLDQFGHWYRLEGEKLSKLKDQGQTEVAAFSLPLLGAPQQIELLNPMNPLLFFDDFNQILILDNRLNELRRIDLMEAGFIDPILIAQSEADQVWLYDQVMDRLLRFQLQSQDLLAQSLNITQLIEREEEVIALYSSFNRVLLEVAGVGVLVFDAQGSYKGLRRAPAYTKTAYHNDYLVFFDEVSGAIELYDFKRSQSFEGQIAPMPVKQLQLQKKSLYLFGESQMREYRLDWP